MDTETDLPEEWEPKIPLRMEDVDQIVSAVGLPEANVDLLSEELARIQARYRFQLLSDSIATEAQTNARLETLRRQLKKMQAGFNDYEHSGCSGLDLIRAAANRDYKDCQLQLRELNYKMERKARDGSRPYQSASERADKKRLFDETLLYENGGVDGLLARTKQGVDTLRRWVDLAQKARNSDETPDQENPLGANVWLMRVALPPIYSSSFSAKWGASRSIDGTPTGPAFRFAKSVLSTFGALSRRGQPLSDERIFDLISKSRK